MSKYFIKHCILILVITKKNVNNFLYTYTEKIKNRVKEKHKMMEIVLNKITWQIFLYQLHLGK